MTASRTTLDVRLRALLLSKVVTRVVKAPSLELAHRDVPEPEVVMVPTRHGPVRCYVTRPAPGAPLAVQERTPPVHVNIHGGAFLIGAPRQDDHIVRLIAGEVGAVVVNVDYSTAPSARFPRAVEECHDVLTWVVDSAPARGWDGGRVSVSGGSSGGTLALGAMRLARKAGTPNPVAAVLVVPAVDLSAEPDSLASDGRSAFVSPALMRTMQWAYFADRSAASDPLASPLFDDTAGLPPLLVLSAEQDSLRPQIEAFVARATAAGVPVNYRCLSGVDHDFPLGRSPAHRPHVLSMLQAIKDHLLAHLD